MANESVNINFVYIECLQIVVRVVIIICYIHCKGVLYVLCKLYLVAYSEDLHV